MLLLIVAVFLLDEYFCKIQTGVLHTVKVCTSTPTEARFFFFFKLDPKESLTVPFVIQLTIVPSRKSDFYISSFDFLFPVL